MRLINTIRKQNKIEESYLCILKMVKDNDNESKRRRNGEDSVIIKVDEESHEIILSREKLNVEWKKCPIFNYISVKRCFKCWGYFLSYIAKNCMPNKNVMYHKCAGNHEAKKCTASKEKCVNCML